MSRAILFALLLVVPQSFDLAAQDKDDLAGKIEQIIPSLSDDSIDLRDRAVQALADLGPTAIPLLRKRAAELGTETRGRLLEAVSRIELRNTLAKYLPPLRKITLEWENKPFREALDEIGRRTGLTLDTSNAGGDASVSFSLKDATPLEAIDEICRKAGLTCRTVDDDFFGGGRRRMMPAAVPGGGRMLIQNGKMIEYPAAYVRHYRIRVTQVSMTRTNNFQANQSNAQISLDLGWAADVKPDALQSFKITELKDDQGRSLLIDENDRVRGRIRAMRGRYRGRDMGGYSQYLSFKYPEADAKKVATLKGTTVFSYPQEVKSILFDKPSESVGKTVELNGLTITLKDYQEKGTGHSLTMEMTGKYQGAREAEGGDEDDLSSNLPFSYEDVELLTESGEPLRNQGMSGRGDGKSYTWTLDFDSEKASPAKGVRIFCVLRRFSDEVAFEIKDIALPR